LTDTDLIAELIVLVPVEVFDMFKRTTYYLGGTMSQIFEELTADSNSVSRTGLFFIEVTVTGKIKTVRISRRDKNVLIPCALMLEQQEQATF
jgi:hypothetical protein